jgi:hypothetical protein
LTLVDVGVMVFFMRILVFVGWCRGFGLLGIYFGLARAASWRVFLVNFCDAIVLGAAVIGLTDLAGIHVALPTATLLGAAAGGVAGLVWLERALGGVAPVLARRIAGWALAILATGLFVGTVDMQLISLVRGGSPLVHLLAVGLLTPMLLVFIGRYFHLAEFDTAVARLKDIVRRRLGLGPHRRTRRTHLALRPDIPGGSVEARKTVVFST